MMYLLVVLLPIGIIGWIFGLIWLIGREYDRHPWFRKALDAEASLHVPPQYGPPDLPKEYVDQAPGWDSRP